MRVIAREDIDVLKCDCPDCKQDGPLFVHSECHVGEPTWVRLEPGKPTATVLCYVCDRVIVEILVGRREDS